MSNQIDQNCFMHSNCWSLVFFKSPSSTTHGFFSLFFGHFRFDVPDLLLGCDTENNMYLSAAFRGNAKTGTSDYIPVYGTIVP